MIVSSVLCMVGFQKLNLCFSKTLCHETKRILIEMVLIRKQTCKHPSHTDKDNTGKGYCEKPPWKRISTMASLYDIFACKLQYNNKTNIIWGKVVPHKIIYIKLFNFFYFVVIFIVFIPSWCFLLTAVLSCIRLFNTNNSTQSLTRRYQHTANKIP